MTSKNTVREQMPLPDDLKVFITVVRKEGFAAAAAELGQSPAYVSKRIKMLEAALSTKLFHRTTRRINLTEDGKRVQRWAMRILEDFDDLFDDLSQAKASPRGHLHICSSFGFGRLHVAPAIATLSQQNPNLELRLDIFDREVDLTVEGFDLEVRVGDDLPEQHISKKLFSNRRILCASPDYLARHGIPRSAEELPNHSCLVLKERGGFFGIWKLTDGEESHTVKVGGPLSSNSGEIIVKWALEGQGIILRSVWDVQPYLDSGQLQPILPELYQSANVWAIYPTRLSNSAKLRVAVEYLTEHFQRLSI